jgi:CRP-like cAMP-binding protein
VQLLLRMHTTFYSAGSIVASAGEVADRLMIIVSGRVKVSAMSKNN